MENEFDPVDLSNCDREPIHIPGFIQSHGCLLVLQAADGHIISCSANIETFFALTPAQVLGKPLQQILSTEQGDLIRNVLLIGSSGPGFDALNPVSCRINHQSFDLIISQLSEKILLEFEVRPASAHPITIQPVMTQALARIQSVHSTQELLEQVAEFVKRISGYDRVMIYKFHADQHGEVVTEAKNESLDSLLHLHYPASDIPQQARHLYKLNLVRIIADAGSTPVPILGLENQPPLDLTHSVLRAVSPIHIEYLKNMGVVSSFSISLMYQEELWGLIACHNYSLKPILAFTARTACRFIGQLFSASLEYRMNEDMKSEISSYAAAARKLYDQMDNEAGVALALTAQKTNLLSVNQSQGAAIFYDNQWTTVGNTPPAEQLNAFQSWLKSGVIDSVFFTHRAADIAGKGLDAANASGVLAISLADQWNELIIWFKPEYRQTIAWAGNPEKPVEINLQGERKISPRKSFEAWMEEVRHTSTPWTAAELESAAILKNYIVQVIFKKANEVRVLNDRLRKAYQELDTFSYTISHDLRVPLSSIKNYTELFLEEFQNSVPPNGIFLLNNVLRRVEQMEQLIHDVLAYTKISRAGTVFDRVWMTPLLTDMREELLDSAKNRNLKIVLHETPDVSGDKTMIRQLFQNLIGNAVKYSTNREYPVVSIRAAGDLKGFVVYEITDNGIGFDMEHSERIFELFHRNENARTMDGTGVGLAIVKRIVEKNGGSIWVESSPGKGSTFSVRLLHHETKHL